MKSTFEYDQARGIQILTIEFSDDEVENIKNITPEKRAELDRLFETDGRSAALMLLHHLLLHK